MRYLRNVFVVTVMGLFLIPMLAHLGTDDINIDNRTLSPIPSWNGSLQAWFSGWDSYLNDNFGLRNDWVRLNRDIRGLIGENPSDVAVGKDGWLFLNNEPYRAEFEGTSDWTQERVGIWIEALRQIRAAADDKGLPFAAVIATDKARMYPDKLPNDWGSPSSRRFRDAVYGHAEADEVGLIDHEPLFKKLKDTGLLLYSPRDTHWNRNGAYEVAELLWDVLDPDDTLDRYRFDGEYVDIATSRPMDLETMSGYSESREPAYLQVPSFNQADLIRSVIPFQTDRAKALPFAIPHGRVSRSEYNPDAKGTLLILGDSFSILPMEYLQSGYNSIIEVHVSGGNFPLEEIMELDADAIVVIVSEREAWQMDGVIDINP
ncbi:MAG: hypothetical protein AAF311_02550 [Pseudomonadota bacterium]